MQPFSIFQSMPSSKAWPQSCGMSTFRHMLPCAFKASAGARGGSRLAARAPSGTCHHVHSELVPEHGLAARAPSGRHHHEHSELVPEHGLAADLLREGLLGGGREHLLAAHEGGGHAAVQRQTRVRRQLVAVLQRLLRRVRKRLRIPHLNSISRSTCAAQKFCCSLHTLHVPPSLLHPSTPFSHIGSLL